MWHSDAAVMRQMHEDNQRIAHAHLTAQLVTHAVHDPKHFPKLDRLLIKARTEPARRFQSPEERWSAHAAIASHKPR